MNQGGLEALAAFQRNIDGNSIASLLAGIPGHIGTGEGVGSINGTGTNQTNATLFGSRINVDALPSAYTTAAINLSSGADAGGYSGARIGYGGYMADAPQTIIGFIYTDPRIPWPNRGILRTGRGRSNAMVSGAFSTPLYKNGLRGVSISTDLIHHSSIGYSSAKNIQALYGDRIAPDSLNSFKSIVESLGVPLATTAASATPGVTTVRSLGVLEFEGALPGRVYSNLEITHARSNLGGNTGFSVGQHSQKDISGGFGTNLYRSMGAGLLSSYRAYISKRSSNLKSGKLLPQGIVRISSLLPSEGGNLSENSISDVDIWFGGGGQRRTRSEFMFDGGASLAWNSISGKWTSNLGLDYYSSRSTSDMFRTSGVYEYGSLNDLRINSADIFRISVVPEAQNNISTAALYYSLRSQFGRQFYYSLGFRGEVSSYWTTAANDSSLERFLGYSPTSKAKDMRFSPKIAVTWVPFNSPRRKHGVVHFGSSENRGDGYLFGAQNAKNVQCIGTDIIQPDWASLVADETSQVLRCADENPADPQLSVPLSYSLADAGYAAPRSWSNYISYSRGLRLSARWMPKIIIPNRLSLRVAHVINSKQASTFDLNQNSSPFFHLSNEGGRPVYADPARILPTSGMISERGTRSDTTLNSVLLQGSDGKSKVINMTLGVNGGLDHSRYVSSEYSLRYNLMSMKQYSRGNDILNPHTLSWDRDWRTAHAIHFSAVHRRSSWSARVNGSVVKGFGYTPGIDRDINGYVGSDPAFIFVPSAAPDNNVGNAMQEMLKKTSESARQCLEKQTGKIAEFHSCSSPVTMNLNLEIGKVFFGTSYLGVTVNNFLGVLDYVAHAGSRKGWGDFKPIDQTLLRLNSFDQATQQYQYTVNQNFGRSVYSQSFTRRPVLVSFRLQKIIRDSPEVSRIKAFLRTTSAYDAAANFNAIAGAGTRLFPTLLLRRNILLLTEEQVDSIAIRMQPEAERFEQRLRMILIELSDPKIRSDMIKMKALMEQVTREVKILRRESALEIKPFLAKDQWDAQRYEWVVDDGEM